MKSDTVKSKSILFILGGQSTAIEIRELVDVYFSDKYDIVYNVIDENETTPYSSISDVELESICMSNKDKNLYYITSFSDFILRNQFITEMNLLGVSPVNIIHPLAQISKSACLGSNIYIASNVIVSSFCKLGDNIILNYNTVLGHHSVIKSNVIINPSVNISGNVTIGSNVLIGAGAFIYQGLTIGENSLIDALTYIDRNIQNNMICSSKRIKVFKRVV